MIPRVSEGEGEHAQTSASAEKHLCLKAVIFLFDIKTSRTVQQTIYRPSIYYHTFLLGAPPFTSIKSPFTVS